MVEEKEDDDDELMLRYETEVVDIVSEKNRLI